MRVLITGAAGFVGQHLLRELLSNGHQPVAFDSHSASVPEGVQFHSGDLCNTDFITRVIAEARPDACVHLAAVSFVPDGNTNTVSVFNVNVLGTLRLLDAFRAGNKGAIILVVSTAHVYGVSGNTRPLPETAPLSPASFYAISKACADGLSLAYSRDYAMRVCTARPNNHIGPGQGARFVIPSFARQIKAASRSGQPVNVGNLDSIRDFADVRDVVRAYRLILERGDAGKAYNISSQNFLRVGDIADRFCAMAGRRIELKHDPALYRPTDTSPLLDTSRIETETGWRPLIPFDKTLRDIWESI